MNSAIDQAKKKKNIFDMMVSMHCKLRDKYNRWNVLFDCLEVLTSVILCGITFYSFPDNISFYLGIASILLFALTLIKQRLNLKKKAERHHLAGKLYLAARLDLEQQIGIWVENSEEQDKILIYIREKYRELSEATPIPEKMFHKLKHHHQYKVEFSKFLDKNKSSPWIICKLKFLFCSKEIIQPKYDEKT